MNFRFHKEGPQKANKVRTLAFESRKFELKLISFEYKNAIFSVLYRFLRTPKDVVVVIFLLSRETPVETEFYMWEIYIWDKHDDILLVLAVTALWATNKTPR